MFPSQEKTSLHWKMRIIACESSMQRVGLDKCSVTTALKAHQTWTRLCWKGKTELTRQQNDINQPILINYILQQGPWLPREDCQCSESSEDLCQCSWDEDDHGVQLCGLSGVQHEPRVGRDHHGLDLDPELPLILWGHGGHRQCREGNPGKEIQRWQGRDLVQQWEQVLN